MTLSDPAEPDTPVSPQPVSGVVAPEPPEPAPTAAPDDTPAYGIPVPPQDGPWPAGPAGPAHASHPAETVRLRTIPAAGHTHDSKAGGGGGGGGGPEKRTGPAARKPLALLIGAAAAVALSGTAVAVWALPGSAENNEAVLLDAKASTPVTSAAPAAPSASPSPSKGSHSPSASPSPSASKSASASPSASPSPSASRTSPPPSPSPSPSASRSASPPPKQAPTLRHGDSGSEVEKLQRLLAAQGLYRGRINGRFDWRVEEAVSEFQYDRGIDDQEWGFYGPVTRKALEG
ncbi:peptidoglycan-binding domain-containing protein [Streptomyces sp. NBC_01207]|uniref:peptidoglycan-binding domain-containing protein n=1 Tax=Streptomyces sp. NBC_01207 TaxID=2903772 RepID=UPI002E0E45FA|nr:peptidoglycan-binding protein [Streptomyces sp. NBC_01207]